MTSQAPNMNYNGSDFNQRDNQAVALAGILQAADLVKEIATTGYLNTRDFETNINSLFIQNPLCTLDVYGSLGNIERGLTRLEALLESQIEPKDKIILPYALGINNLAVKLNKNTSMLASVASKLDTSQQQVAHFGLTHDNVIASIADCYTQTISTFQYRIQVKGEYTYLQQPRVANQIRSLLLSGIRSSILWQQNGGSLLKLLFSRRALKTCTKTLLQQAKNENSLL